MRVVAPLLALSLLAGCQANGRPEATRPFPDAGVSTQASDDSVEWTLRLVEATIHPVLVTSIAVSDGRLGAVDDRQDAWVVESGQWRRIDLPALSTWVTSASADRLVFGTTDGHACVWRSETERAGCARLPFPDPAARVRVVGDTALVSSPSGYALVDVETASVIASVRTELSFGSMTLTDAPGLIRATNDAGLTVEWSIRDGRVTRVDGVPALTAMSTVLWGARGARFIVAEGRVAVLSTYTYGREVPDAEWEGQAALLDGSGDLNVVAAVSGSEEKVLLYDGDLRVRASLPLRSSEEEPQVTALDLSEDGRLLAVAYRDGTVGLYEIRRHAEKSPFP
ncbi:hypothetical protein [Rubrivirga sp.]|uniref:hypothetical protein n=1 Tax=Rubrivirga sp. TaxID=1885344 RepID=UPI003B51D2D4